MAKLKPKQELLKTLEKAKSFLVIVEGKKDKAALEKLGFKNKIVVLHNGNGSLYSILDKINCKECAILTDCDKKGKHYYWTLKQELVKKGVRINDEFRRALLKNKISHIEGLSAYIENHSCRL